MKARKLLAGVGVLVALPSVLMAAGSPEPVQQTTPPIGFSISDANKNLYAINLVNGQATNLGAVNYPDDDELEGLASLGRTLYGVGEAGYGDGALRNITTPPGSLVGLTGPRLGSEAGAALNPRNRAIYNLQADETLPDDTARSFLYAINPSTGKATFIGFDADYADGLAIDGSGRAYATDFRVSDSLYSVNLTTGALTPIGSLGLGDVDLDSGAAIDFRTGALWALSEDGAIYVINKTTGAATFTAFVTVGGQRVPGDLEGLDIPFVGTTPTGDVAP